MTHESLEMRILFHEAFISNGVLVLQGLDAHDDVLQVSRVGNIYRAEAVNDGFVEDFAVNEVTAGISVTGGSGDDQIAIVGDITLPTTLQGGSDDDTINGSTGRDFIEGGSGNDELLGNGNRDNIFGNAGNDVLAGGSKNDTLDGGTGGDVLVGGAGTFDRVNYNGRTAGVSVSIDDLANDGESGEADNISPTCEVFEGGNGNDFIRGSGKPNAIFGGPGGDTLIGGGGNDTLTGDAGRDSLEGQSGNDVLSALDGENDTLSGGSGSGDSAEADENDALDSVP